MTEYREQTGRDDDRTVSQTDIEALIFDLRLEGQTPPPDLSSHELFRTAVQHAIFGPDITPPNLIENILKEIANTKAQTSRFDDSKPSPPLPENVIPFPKQNR